MSGGLTLDMWATLKTAALVASALGHQLEIPGTNTSQRVKHSPAEIARAKAALDRRSALTGLAEI